MKKSIFFDLFLVEKNNLFELFLGELIQNKGIIRQNPLIGSVSAVSCGVFNGEVVADLDYAEDSKCEVDTNFVINQNFDLIEIQGTAENGAMSFDQVGKMYEMAKKAAKEIAEIQKKAIG